MYIAYCHPWHSQKQSSEVCMPPSYKKENQRQSEIFSDRECLKHIFEVTVLSSSFPFSLAMGKHRQFCSEDAVAWLQHVQLQLPPEGVPGPLLSCRYVPAASLCCGTTTFRSQPEHEPSKKNRQLDQVPSQLTAQGREWCWPAGEKAGTHGQGWELNPFWQHCGLKLAFFLIIKPHPRLHSLERQIWLLPSVCPATLEYSFTRQTKL